jgi:hypothetical protein
MSMSCKVGSLGCGDLRSVSRDSVHEDRNPGKRAGIAASIVTAVSTSVGSGSGGSSGCIVSREVGSFSGSDIWGVLDWQGSRVGYCGGVGVAIVPGASVRHADSQQAEERDLKRRYTYLAIV